MKINKASLDLLRAKQCLLTRELAKLAGISDLTIRNGYKQDVDPVSIGKIAKALGVEPEDIIIKEGE